MQVDDAVDYRRQVMRIFFFCAFVDLSRSDLLAFNFHLLMRDVTSCAGFGGLATVFSAQSVLSCAAAASGLRQSNHLFVLSEQMVLIERLQPQDGYLLSS